MAEERLIDEDKDRKYKIRKNADGEDELVIDAEADVEEEFEEVEFEVTESDFDDEEAAVMTPEQLAAREKAREEAEAKRVEELNSHISRAQSLVDEGKFEDATFVLDAAAELDRGNGKVYALKLIALTEGFTKFSNSYDATEAAEGVLAFATAEEKAELAAKTGDIWGVIENYRQKATELERENEAGKSARRAKFTAKRKKSAALFGATAGPLAVFAALAGYFGANMHSQLSNVYMTLFFVFIGLTAACFIATVITARGLWASVNLLKRNEKNSSTKIGREYEAASAELKLLNKINEIFS